MPSRKLLCLLMIAMLSSAPSTVFSQFEELAKWLPDSANTIVLVRAQDILQSQIAEKEHWKTDQLKAFQAGASFLPPATDRLLMAANIDFEFMKPAWQITVLEKSGPAIDISNVAQRVGGNIESIAGKDAITLPNDSYLVEIDEQTLATMSPANRQATVRWLKTRAVADMSLSGYLTKAIKFADQNAELIVAFDLLDVMTPAMIKQRLESKNIVKKDELDAVCSKLGSIIGLTLGITVNDKVSGAIKIDFNSDPSSLASSIKGLLVHALKEHGMMVDAIENWEVQVGSDHLVLRGNLNEAGFRQLSSLVEHPLATDFAVGQADAGGDVDMKTRSMEYFASVQKLISEIRDLNLKGMNAYAKYFDKYARQIDHLSVINVDPVVLSYGAYVADSFRSISGGLDSTVMDKDQQRQTYAVGSSTYHGRGNYSNWNGYTSRAGWGGGLASNQRNRERVAALEREKGGNDTKAVLREIDEATAKVFSQMSQKYQTDFK